LKRAASHDDGLVHRQASERLEVGRKPPRQAAIPTDDAVLRNGNDERNLEADDPSPFSTINQLTSQFVTPLDRRAKLHIVPNRTFAP
jgi:hypothetical protein